MSCGRVTRPPRMSLRYGPTSSRLSGPPYAMMRTAVCSRVMHQIHDRAHGGDVGFGQDAVAEIEDVSGPAVRARENVADLTVALRGRRQQRRGFEIPLDCLGADSRPGSIQRDAPIHADDVPTGRGEVFEEGCRPRAEMT